MAVQFICAADFMNKANLIICSALALLTISSCNTSKHTIAKRAPFATKPVTIDGNDDEWPNPYPYYDSKAMISYAVSNDHDNLYLTVKASDARMRAKILRGGMQVWIDTSGGTDQQLLIQSPMPNALSRDERGQMRQHAGADEPSTEDRREARTRREQMMLDAREYSLKGFGACDGNFSGSTATDNSCGIQLKLGVNQYNELVWEAAIPFMAWHHRLLAPNDVAKTYNICFEVGGVKMAARTTGGGARMGGGGMGGMRMGGGGGGHMGGMGRGGGGRMGGGSMHGGAQNSDGGASLSQTTKTWLKARLAYQ